MNATNQLDYIYVNVVGVTQNASQVWKPTRYIVLLTGPAAGTCIPCDEDD